MQNIFQIPEAYLSHTLIFSCALDIIWYKYSQKYILQRRLYVLSGGILVWDVFSLCE